MYRAYAACSGGNARTFDKPGCRPSQRPERRMGRRREPTGVRSPSYRWSRPERQLHGPVPTGIEGSADGAGFPSLTDGPAQGISARGWRKVAPLHPPKSPASFHRVAACTAATPGGTPPLHASRSAGMTCRPTAIDRRTSGPAPLRLRTAPQMADHGDRTAPMKAPSDAGLALPAAPYTPRQGR